MTEDRRAMRWRSPAEPCLNCGDTTPGRFCPSCGQRKIEVLVSVRTLLQDVLEDQLVLNRALPRTLAALLFRPGFLTSEYVRGRIVRYIAPFRLYLVSSIVFFIILSFVGLQRLAAGGDGARDRSPVPAAADSAVQQDTEADTAVQQDTAAGASAVEQDTAAGAAPAQRDDFPQDTAVGAGAEQDTAGGASAVQRRPDPPVPPRILTAEDVLSADTALMPGTLQPWARNIRFDGSMPLFRRALERKVAQVGHLPVRDAVIELLRDLSEYAPHTIFLLLPLFALLLKLLYIRRSRYYAEHFVFALHVHAFVFVMFTLMFILPWNWLDAILQFWIVAYVWLALKHVYRQGWIRTTLKWWTLGWLYFWLLLFGLLALAVATLLLT